MIPTFLIKSNVPTIAAVKPYTPLELHGRDLYIKEGCVELPLPDGAPVPLRNRTLRRILQSR
jgi:hypothetical protein